MLVLAGVCGLLQEQNIGLAKILFGVVGLPCSLLMVMITVGGMCLADGGMVSLRHPSLTLSFLSP